MTSNSHISYHYRFDDEKGLCIADELQTLYFLLYSLLN
jgi:hypothetical protein